MDQRMTSRRRGRAALVLSAALSAGCVEEDAVPETTAAAAESVEGTVAEGAFLLAAGEGLLATPPGPGVLLTQARVAAFVGGRIASAFRPAGCAAATTSGATVNLSLRDCVSSYGLGHLDGDVAITFDVTHVAPLELSVNVRSANLEVATARVNADVDATITYDRTSTSWQVVARTRTAGVGRRGVPLTRVGGYTLRWSPLTRCADLDGAWSTTTTLGQYSTRLTGLRSCMGRCPEVGGVLVFSGGTPVDTVTITYTGSATAQWQRASGAAGTVTLSCEN